MMSGKEDNRIFVGGLGWDVTERQLEHAFDRYGKIHECQVVSATHRPYTTKRSCEYLRASELKIFKFGALGSKKVTAWIIMMERDTGRPRGFGFITFADRRGMEDAIKEMNGREIGDRIISVNKAQPRMGGDDADQGYRGGYSSGGRGSYGAGDRVGQDDCFKCGRPGHWARDCPLAGGDGGRGRGSFSSRPRFGGAGGHGDRLGERDRYIDDRYDGGRYGDRDRLDSRDYKYSSRDRYASDRYATSGGDRFASDRYGSGSDYLQNGYGKERGYDRYGGARGGADRNGGGIPARDEGRSYRGRPGPYDRPSRVARPSSFDDRY